MECSISIVVPVYNTAEVLDYCIRSIMSQTWHDFELILVDDGSTDDSLQVCQKLADIDSRIKVLHQENAGVSAARNTGLSEAQGQYVGFIDSDDLIAPDYLEYLIQGMLDRDTILSMCGHERIYDYCYQFPAANSQFKMITSQECAIRLLKGRFPVSACCCLFKRSLMGDIRFPVGIQNNEDKLFLCQYLFKNETGTVAFSNEKKYGYIVRDGSATRSSWNGSLDVVTVADQILKDTNSTHPEWGEIAQNACMRARLDVMKSIVRSEKSDHGEETYKQLKQEVWALKFPRNGGRRLKVEYIAVMAGRPAFTLLVKLYYKIYNDKKRFQLNERMIRQG